VGLALGCGVAAALVAAALMIPRIQRLGRAPMRASAPGAGAKPAAPEAVVAGAGSATTKHVWGGAPSVLSQKQATRATETAVARDDEDAIAMSETRAASFPAPPMPLTEQERLLLRMVHQGDGVELAMLDPRLEAMRDADEKEEFQRFFVNPAVKAAKEDSTADATTEQGAPAQAATEEETPEQSSPKQPATEEAAPEAPGQSPSETTPDVKQATPEMTTEVHTPTGENE
jgi:hypothetical protein